MTERGPRALHLGRGGVAATVAIGVCGLLVVLVASASGPVGFVSAPASTATETRRSVTPSSPAVSAPPSTTAEASPQPDPPALAGFVVLLIQVLLWAAVLLLLLVLLRAVWRRTPRWSSRIQSRTQVASLPDIPEELTRSADARMALLAQGTPRNAIVACWLDLEEGAASVGLPRDPSETSAEYTSRVLATWDIAPDALSGLAQLYREARFSRHSLTEEHRAAAIAQLTALHDDLRRVAGERAAARAAVAAATVAAGDRRTSAGAGPEAGVR
jgi:hypothetical protein